MPNNPKEETEVFVEFPEIHTYMFHKKSNHIYITFYDNIMEKEYTMLLDAYQFLQWIGTKQIHEIKTNTIKQIKQL